MTTIDRSYRADVKVEKAPVRPPLPPPPPRERRVELNVRDEFTPAAAKQMVDLKGGVPAPTISPEQIKLTTSPAFQALNPGVQQAALETINDPLIEDEGKRTLIAAITSPGFGQLSTEDAEAFLEYAGNTIPRYGAQLRTEIAAHLASDDFREPSRFPPIPLAISQAAELRRISEGREALPAATPTGKLPGAERTISVTGPQANGDYQFFDEVADSQRYTFESNGHEISVIYPTERNEGAPSPEELQRLLETLPDAAFEAVDQVTIESRAHDGASVGADLQQGLVRIFPNDQRSRESLQSSLVHEAALNLGVEALGDQSLITTHGDRSDLSEGWQSWADAVEADGHFVSDGARDSLPNYNADFAETVELYCQVRGTPAEAEFARLYPARYDIIRDTLGDG